MRVSGWMRMKVRVKIWRWEVDYVVRGENDKVLENGGKGFI